MAPMTDPNPDIQRLREEYTRRAQSVGVNDRYASTNPAYQWMMATRHQAIIELLDHFQRKDLSQLRILEMGCGSGGVLQEFISLGAEPSNLYGVDLLFDRLRVASCSLPACSYTTANGQQLPLPADSFDLVLQFTAFSSILDPSTKLSMAAEMVRVLKSGGGILWYDFVWNPLNRQTDGIPLSQVKKLFPGMQITSRRITLAPPLTRILLPRFQSIAKELTKFWFLNSHLLIWIQKDN